MNEIKLVETEWGKVAIYDRPNLDCISATIAGGTFWDGPLLLPFYEKYSDPKKLAIDIGSFNGIGALYLSKRNRHVLAVEPIHGELASATITANALGNVTLLRGAAYSSGTWLTAAPDSVQGQAIAGVKAGEIDNPGGIALVKATLAEQQTQECIQGFALDKWVDEGEQVGLIKSDAQGSDLQALKGLRKTIERCKPAILFEFEEHLAMMHGDGWEGHMRFLVDIGYGWEEQDKVGYARNYVAVPR